MTIEFKDDTLHCAGVLAVEDAEALLALVAGHPAAPVDLSACAHVHTACLQVLMASAASISAWPGAPELSEWLRAALPQH
ncbi:hypothetical protein RB25_20610 [Herbaspirillum rubrisubalbicans]|uniref:hypothetical protein n=1 Tax=Herbaspirillum rubrisubalbicans TaxID=80842 RepID=UPI000DC27C7D|nr:hypothetical protein [Herbaspirillum rubrisubalbicans]RAN44257.1 hypothetical protein RB25_20610 [Herbaspirillum rubrisubalbicans]